MLALEIVLDDEDELDDEEEADDDEEPDEEDDELCDELLLEPLELEPPEDELEVGRVDELPLESEPCVGLPF